GNVRTLPAVLPSFALRPAVATGTGARHHHSRPESSDASSFHGLPVHAARARSHLDRGVDVGCDPEAVSRSSPRHAVGPRAAGAGTAWSHGGGARTLHR